MASSEPLCQFVRHWRHRAPRPMCRQVCHLLGGRQRRMAAAGVMLPWPSGRANCAQPGNTAPTSSEEIRPGRRKWPPENRADLWLAEIRLTYTRESAEKPGPGPARRPEERSPSQHCRTWRGATWRGPQGAQESAGQSFRHPSNDGFPAPRPNHSYPTRCRKRRLPLARRAQFRCGHASCIAPTDCKACTVRHRRRGSRPSERVWRGCCNSSDRR